MSTIKEREEQTRKNQLCLTVKALIDYMNKANDLKITIDKEETERTTFEFTLEYLPYEDNKQNLHRRVSNLEVEEFIENVFNNIEDFIGGEYNRGSGFIHINLLPNVTQQYLKKFQYFSDSGKLFFYKKVHINIFFVEKR